MPQHCKKGCLLDHIPEGDWNAGRLLSHSDNVSLTNAVSSWHGRIDTELAEPLHLPTHNSSPCWLAPFKISLGCEVTIAPKPGGAAAVRAWWTNSASPPSDKQCGICSHDPSMVECEPAVVWRSTRVQGTSSLWSFSDPPLVLPT